MMIIFATEQVAAEALQTKNRFRSGYFGRTEEAVPVCPASICMNGTRQAYRMQGLISEDRITMDAAIAERVPLPFRSQKQKVGRSFSICHRTESE